MPRETQNKILRVLVDQTFQRVGGSTKVAVDVRIISSTARNLEAEIADGRFREDLYHRLSVVPIRVPPLAERREDIPDAGRLFHGPDFAGDRPAEAPASASDAMAVLQIARLARQRAPAAQQRRTADDPGRRRSRCRHHRQHAAAGRRLDGAEHAERQRRRALMGLPLREAREVFEREYLRGPDQPLRRQISRTAEFVGMERSALHRKLKALGIG